MDGCKAERWTIHRRRFCLSEGRQLGATCFGDREAQLFPYGLTRKLGPGAEFKRAGEPTRLLILPLDIGDAVAHDLNGVALARNLVRETAVG